MFHPCIGEDLLFGFVMFAKWDERTQFRQVYPFQDRLGKNWAESGYLDGKTCLVHQSNHVL